MTDISLSQRSKRSKLEKELGKKLFYQEEIAKIIHHLGKVDIQSIEKLEAYVRNELRSQEIEREEKEDLPEIASIPKHYRLYKEDTVWDWFQKLGKENEIVLTQRSMKEVLEEKLHERPYEENFPTITYPLRAQP